MVLHVKEGLVNYIICHMNLCLQTKIQEGRMSGEAAAKLCTLAAQCAAYDFVGAQKTQTELASIDWSHTKDWLRGVRGMVSLALIKSAAGAR